MKLLFALLVLAPTLAIAQQDDRYYPGPGEPPVQDDTYYPMPGQPSPQQPTSEEDRLPKAVISCDIDYTGPDGRNVIKIVNQKLSIPLSSRVVYYDSMQIGERQLDYSAENVGGRKMVGLTLWYISGKGTVCDTNKPNAATCAFKSKTNQEQANIVCKRLQ